MARHIQTTLIVPIKDESETTLIVPIEDETETERNAALLASLLSERLDVRLDVIGRPFQRGKDIRVRILFDGVVVAEAEDGLPDERD